MIEVHKPSAAPGVFPIDSDMADGVNIPLSDDLELKVIAHRNESYNWFKGHYMEMLMSQRDYLNTPVTFNKYKVEHFLRYNYQAVVGNNRLGQFQLLGWVNNKFTASNPATIYANVTLTGKDVSWIIPDELIPDNPMELNEFNKSGNFIVLRNKVVPYISDFETLDMQAKKYAEIEGSIYSMLVQAKVSTFFQSEVHDETTNQLIQKIYNGSPFIKVSTLLRPDREIININNDKIPELLKSMRDAQNAIIADTNNAFGIDSSGIVKQSGVSDAEVHSNDDARKAVENIYIPGIQEPFNLFNEKYGTDYHVYLNQVPSSDLNVIQGAGDYEDNN